MLGMVWLLSSFGRNKNGSAEREITSLICGNIDVFTGFIKDSLQPAIQSGNEQMLQSSFLNARKYYKKIEWATEYFAFTSAKFINGAPKAEAELTGRMIQRPTGLQVMEEYIFPDFDTTSREILLQQSGIILEKLSVFKTYFSGIPLAAWQIIDGAKQEVFRIETLGITGYDNPLSKNSMEECATALQALVPVLKYYSAGQDNVLGLLQENISFLRSATDFNSFDRARYIREFANPLSTAIEQLRRGLDFQGYHYNRLLKQDAFTLFDINAFDADAYSPFLEQEHKREKAELGKALFRDPAFSANRSISCASCHQPEKSFAENLPKHPDVSGTGLIDRNVPSLLNAALQPQLFYDQRAETLEDQVSDVVHNPKEMGGSIRLALKHFGETGKYQQLFAAAFPGMVKPDSAAITEALAAYVRSLVKLDSRFDEYMQGKDGALSKSEVNGFNLFMGKANCGSCHFMPLFNGVLPPKYITQDAEIIGVPVKKGSKAIDPDRGLFNYLLGYRYFDSSRLSEFDHAFKTVTVRNVTKTAPYMHNGVYETLDDVMDFYNEGGGTGNGLVLSNQSLSEQKLALSPEEIQDIIAFMKSLDSK
ncbi:cytochrome C peroxidase [Chitinophaga caeni]|uniref:Cytochrome C peroxidase n=2 Tax=Chitinophaga caeni TaxID=2029983 RepID=A0A291QRR3_9BACT|nr:cytochrome C peroxidase [Chitinophaga caeni]